MKVISEIFLKPLAAFLAFKAIKDALAESTARRNAISSYVAGLEQKRNQATAKLYEKQSIEAFKELVAIRLEHDEAIKAIGETLSSLGIADNIEATESDEARDTLRDALKAYADQLKQRIQQLQTDAREMAERSSVDYSEPPACGTLRAEQQKALDGIACCNDHAVDGAFVWRTYSPLIRIGSGALSTN